MKNFVCFFLMCWCILYSPYIKAAELSPMEQMIANEIVNMFSGSSSAANSNNNSSSYNAYCINGRIVIDRRSMDRVIAKYPMSSNDVYIMMKFDNKNQATRWAANQGNRCPRRK